MMSGQELCFDLNVADISRHDSLATENMVIRFLRRLPFACHEAKVGLDPKKTRLTMRVIPEQPEGHAFEKQVFMGGGAHSERDCGLLFGKLEEALTVLSGMQQNGLMGYEFDEDSDREDGERLEAIVRDMAMALTGKEINLK